MINLKEWLNTNELYDLRHAEHAIRLKNVIKAREASEALRLTLEALEDSRPLRLIDLKEYQREGA
jgi:hypothetical protein